MCLKALTDFLYLHLCSVLDYLQIYDTNCRYFRSGGSYYFSWCGTRYSLHSPAAVLRISPEHGNLTVTSFSFLSPAWLEAALQKASALIGINAPGLFSVSWLDNCSLCPSPPQFVWNDSCSWSDPGISCGGELEQFRTGSADGRLLWLKSDIPDFFHHTFASLPFCFH